VPEGSVPANDLISGPFPVTGPYEIATVADQQLTLRRNPHFRSWDPQVRPDGYPDEIVVNSGIDPADQVSMVESGKADYMAEQIPADAFPALRTQYTPQLHVALGSTTFFFLNTTIAPFDKPAVRKALSFAVDRAHVVDLRGGEIAAAVTCQVLPPNFPGYEPYCPYTADPGPGGRWTAPDLTTARQLVAASGTTGMKITVGPTPPRLTPLAEYVAGILRDLGYDVTVRTAQTGEEAFKAIFAGEVSIGAVSYYPDFPTPFTFFGQFTCDQHDPFTHFCGADLDALVSQASQLQATDRTAANRKWAEVDRTVTDLSLWVPLVNEGSSFVSARLGNYQFSPGLGVLLDQAWVK
jgi:peptide/nickel transport system substrate-binding protein